MTAITVTLRRAGPNDFAEVFRLKSEPPDVYWGGHAAPPDRVRLSDWYAGALTRRVILLAEAAGRVVGYAYLVPNHGEVETAVGVSQAEAGRGFGRRIIAQAADLAGEIYPGRRVGAWIFPQNRASVRAHEAAGYVHQPGVTRRIALAADPGINVQEYWVHGRPAARAGA